ncbi:Fur-regulated basic protein FbpA [Fictibacillus sp. Mic-4]|uniref:Fur-regulated basic protein FbpA n=1 Tax=Fictibacillus sp. Mic-4 TaxID=3132826 RepID=UPI003CE915FA
MELANSPGLLRRAVEGRKKMLIRELITCGIFEHPDGRQLYELTLTELEDEFRFLNLKREGDVVF